MPNSNKPWRMQRLGSVINDDQGNVAKRNGAKPRNSTASDKGNLVFRDAFGGLDNPSRFTRVTADAAGVPCVGLRSRAWTATLPRQ